jgi:catechol 2,3-dioxygenase-like lactoylglutathione lyase family enzyme
MRFMHFGFKVHDIEKTSAAYRELFGLDWEPIKEFTLPTRVGDSFADARSKVTHAWTDDGVEIELVQTVEGLSVDDALLGDREGMSHIAFQVEDLAAERAKAEARGANILSEGTAPRASWFFILDERLGGALVQLVELHEKPAAT